MSERMQALVAIGLLAGLTAVVAVPSAVAAEPFEFPGETAGSAATTSASDGNRNGPRMADQEATLQETLEAGLKARRPVEFEFIARVVQLVEEDRLPVPLVLGTFQWARRQHPQYPFVYFERALKIRARKAGVSL